MLNLCAHMAHHSLNKKQWPEQDDICAIPLQPNYLHSFYFIELAAWLRE